jgi:hypothetical protein
MGESNIRRIFERLDNIQSDVSEIKGLCCEREKRICNLEKCDRQEGADKKWLQWLVGALIGIIGSLVGVAIK